MASPSTLHARRRGERRGQGGRGSVCTAERGEGSAHGVAAVWFVLWVGAGAHIDAVEGRGHAALHGQAPRERLGAHGRVDALEERAVVVLVHRLEAAEEAQQRWAGPAAVRRVASRPLLRRALAQASAAARGRTCLAAPCGTGEAVAVAAAAMRRGAGRCPRARWPTRREVGGCPRGDGGASRPCCVGGLAALPGGRRRARALRARRSVALGGACGRTTL